MPTIREVWNGRRTFSVKGHYLELLDTTSPVDIYLHDEDGNEIAREMQVEQGYFVDRRGVRPFGSIAIVTGASEAVKFVYTDGQSGTKVVPLDVQDDASTRGAYVQDGIAQGAADAQILAANSSRKGLGIQNQDAATALYITCDGSAATADKESFKIPAGGYWEPRVVPTGEIRGISASGTIDIHVWEV